jgi:glycosyltransferase involved in cell wall biosynthesis
MIFLNGLPYMDEAIESVLAQEYRDWELVLVDDGSTDGSSELAKSYADAHPARIRYVEHEGHANLGMSASRNRGIAEARGEFVCFLDADDIWLPRRLSEHVAMLDANPEVGMVYGPTLYWFSWHSKQDVDPFFADQSDVAGDMVLSTGRVHSPPSVLTAFLTTRGGSLPGICSLLCRKEVCVSLGGFESSFRGLYEDQVFLSKVCLNVPVMIHPQVLDYYRQHPDSHCYQAIGRGDYDPDKPHPARGRYLDWLESYLKSHRIDDPVIWSALKKEQFPYRHPTAYAVANAPGEAVERARRFVARRVPRGVRTKIKSLVLGRRPER